MVNYSVFYIMMIKFVSVGYTCCALFMFAETETLLRLFKPYLSKMPKISEEDQVIIKHYRIDKGYGARKLLAEFPDKGWTRSGLEYLIRKIDATGSHKRVDGSGRPRSARTEDNIESVEELILSQEEAPGTHESQREIAMHTGISRSSVHRIVHKDLNLNAFKKIK